MEWWSFWEVGFDEDVPSYENPVEGRFISVLPANKGSAGYLQLGGAKWGELQCVQQPGVLTTMIAENNDQPSAGGKVRALAAN